ncbi:MAG: hypothetical protein Q7T41_01735 [Candidatus Saccharibacteria bacterium]|nr:hypothetical protein [Candidatus Saccharibacteria bacterium]
MDETPKKESTTEETPINPAPLEPPQTPIVEETPAPEPALEPQVQEPAKEPPAQEQPEEPAPTPPPPPAPEPIPEPAPQVEVVPPPTPESIPTPPIIEVPIAPPAPPPDPIPEPPKPEEKPTPVKEEPATKEPKVETPPPVVPTAPPIAETPPPTLPIAPAIHDPKYTKDIPQKVLELTPEEINAARLLWAREHIAGAQIQANKNRNARMNRRMDEIEKIVKAKPQISVHEIANGIQLSQKLTSGYLQKLVRAGRIHATGNTNSRRFYK